MRIMLVAADISENSLGRVYVLWLLARHLGWEVTTVGSLGKSVWPPLSGTEFGDSVRAVRDLGGGELRSLASGMDLIIGCKPRPESSGLAIKLSKLARVPVLIDVDDPDLEFQFDFVSSKQRFRRWVTRPSRRIGYHLLRRNLYRYPLIVSNPVLQRKYGGWIVPHARVDTGAGIEPLSTPMTIAFVGTTQPHKGVSDLRRAVAAIATRQPGALKLVVTDAAPSDARDFERWIGVTSMSEGLEILRRADVVVLPSRPGNWSDAQLPAKLMDAMVAGRAICATDVGPISWAVGEGGLVVPPADPLALEEALERLLVPSFRRELGAKAREQALTRFVVHAVAPAFEEATMQAAGWKSSHDPKGSE